MGIDEGDEVIAVQISDGASQVFIGTRDGMAIRFPEDDVRPMGRTAYGVRGISLREGDEVVAMEVVKPGGTLLTVTELGYGKRTPLEEYRVQSRGGLGLKNVEITEKNGKVIGISQVDGAERELLLITEQGKILRTPTEQIRTIGRATQGVRLMDLDEDDRLVSTALVDRDEETAAVEPNGEPAAEPPEEPPTEN
jgi:DNA gyrase subunit A